RSPAQEEKETHRRRGRLRPSAAQALEKERRWRDARDSPRRWGSGDDLAWRGGLFCCEEVIVRQESASAVWGAATQLHRRGEDAHAEQTDGRDGSPDRKQSE